MQTPVLREELCSTPMMSNLVGDHAVRHNIMTGSRLTSEFSVQPLQTISNSGTGGFSINFRYQNSYGHAIDPSLVLHARVSFVIEAGVVNLPIDFKHSSTRFCFASNPLHRVIQNLSVRVNGSDVQTAPPYQTIAALHRYDDQLEYRQWLCNRQPDSMNSQTLLKSFISSAGKNVFNNALEDSAESCRGALIPECTVLQAYGVAAKQQVKFTFNLYEVLKSPLFKRIDQAYDALHRINEIDVSILFNDIRGMITSLLIYDSGGNLCSIRNTQNTAATSDQSGLTGTDWLQIDSLELLGRSYLPTITVPSNFIRPLYDFDILPTPFTCVADGTTSTVVSVNNLNWSIVPEKIYIYAIPSAVVLANQADAFACIDQVVINSDVASGSLSVASPWQLYEMSLRNGLKMTFDEFSNTVGSVCCINLCNSDLSGYIPGSAIKQQLSIRVTLRNTTSNEFGIPHNSAGSQGLSSFRGSYSSLVGITNWTLYVVALRSGHAVFADNTLQQSFGFDASVLAGKDFTNPDEYKQYDVDRYLKSMHGGGFGSFFSGVKDFFTNVAKNPVVQDIGKTIAKTGLQLASQAAQGAMMSADPRAKALGMVATPLLGLAENQLGSGYKAPRRRR